MIDTDRSLLKYILLTFVTCGIYNIWFLYRLSFDVNIMCEDDGQTTPGVLTYILLSIITCGIYSFIWYYKLGNRLALNAQHYNLSFREDGTTILLWLILGNFLCGLGYWVALYILINNVNALAFAYNSRKTAM